jgi:membrane protein
MPFLPKKIDASVRRKIGGPGAGSFKAVLRLLYVLAEGFFDEQISLRAASLVYTTLLAFVPLVAVSFSVLKAFGVNAKLEIMFYYFLEPMGEKGIDISLSVIKFVEHMKVAVLGALGLSMLLYTAVSAVSKMEAALNQIWHAAGIRSLGQRFTSYLSVLFVGPVLGFTAISLIVSLKSSHVLKLLLTASAAGHLAYAAGRIFTYLLVSAAFTLVYLFLPNTKVRLRSALAGGCIAGITWGVMGWAYASFVASSAKYSAIYSGIAALFLFIIWLYWNWLVLLAGARVSFYHQHPRYFMQGEGSAVQCLARERAAFSAAALIARNFYSGGSPLEATSLGARLGIPDSTLHDVLSALANQGILMAGAGEPHAYLPARDPGMISLKDIVEAVRSGTGGAVSAERGAPTEPAVEEVLKVMDEAVSASLSEKTLKDLVSEAKGEWTARDL